MSKMFQFATKEEGNPAIFCSRRALLLFGTLGLFLRSATWCGLAASVEPATDVPPPRDAAAPEPVTLGAPAEKRWAGELPVLR